MILLRAAFVACLSISSVVLADNLSSTLKEIQLTESEKQTSSQIVIPQIVVETKQIRECFIRIHSGEGVWMAIPKGKGEAVIKRVYLSENTGGLYTSDGTTSRYLSLATPGQKDIAREQEIEHDFIRQFGYLLRQRHPEDALTLKFFRRYFPVQKQEDFSILGANEGQLELLGGVDPLDQVFHFMQKPSEWIGKECNAERCLFDHPRLGSLVLTHPGSAELILDGDDLLDLSEEKAPLAPEVKSRSELETSLDALPGDVTKAFVLISHAKCPPCQALKREGGAWHKFCRFLRRVRSKKVVALMESTEGETIAESALMSGYALPGKYPQMLVFERDASGVWQAPEVIALDKIAATLKTE